MKSKALSSFLLVTVILLIAHEATAVCGDVTGDGAISASDALSVLRAAVGDHQPMMCEPCSGTTTTTTASTTTSPGASTTTLGGATTTTTIAGSGPFTLHVAANGMGGFMYGSQGRVTSDPAGIDCGDDCSQVYEAGRVVTLTAVASGPYSDFVGWWGDVPASCEYNDDPCTVTMDRDRDVWAMFRGGMMY